MWGARFAAFLMILSALLFAAPACAEINELDLGAIPTSGADASSSMHLREVKVVHAWACEDELNFLNKILDGETSGDFPTGYLIAKAAWAAGGYENNNDLGLPVANRVITACSGEEPVDVEKWRRQFYINVGGRETERFEGADAIFKEAVAARDQSRYLAYVGWLTRGVQKRYVQLFGPDCDGALLPVRYYVEPPIKFDLTPACLMAQVRAVIENPWLGAWEVKNGVRIPRDPGTTASKLPCPTEWALVNNGLAPADWVAPWDDLRGVGGDWDMSVISHTRLAHLIYRAKATRPELSGNADAALLKLNHWILTLRGGPAKESYQPFWDCGNPTNSFGSAQDYVNDNDVYSQELQKDVSGKDEGSRSFWDSLWKFLRFLLVVAAIAFAIGLLLGLGMGLAAALGAGLAAAAAAVGIMILLIVGATVWISGIQETENHLFMQNSSKYLKNKLMMAELKADNDRDGFDKVASQNEDVRKWLLKRMQSVVEDDFVEYNAKPYAQFSHEAILNLLDYACDVSWSWDQAKDPPLGGARACDAKDQAIVTAAAAVYDLSAAKVALGSSQGRRLIPFRRLLKENMRYRDPWVDDGKVTQQPKHIMDLGGGSDHLVAALQFWAGTTQHGKNGHASASSIGEMMWYATSRYHPHSMILDLALDKSTPIEQSYKHGGFERYSSGPRWLLTAGGDTEHAAQGLEMNMGYLGFLGAKFNIYWFSPTDDKGTGVSTTLMGAGQAAPRDTYKDFLRFEGWPDRWPDDDGSKMESFAHNKCVSGSFACGLRLEIPQEIKDCLKTAPGGPSELKFLDSGTCDAYKDGDGDTSNDFYLAVYEGQCGPSQFPCKYSNWGFWEIAEAKDFGTLAAYEAAYIARNKGQFDAWGKSGGDSKLTFWSVARKREIKFTPYDEDFDQDCRACGSIVKQEDDEKFRISNPRFPGQSILIDLEDAENPKRSGEGGLSLGNP